MFKLIALDIDDTLLDTQRRLSPENKDAIARARAAGVTITIATGRAFYGARSICEKIELDNLPVITFGGAQVNEYPSGKVLFAENLSHQLVRECIDFARAHHVYIQCYEGDDFLYEAECEESRFYEKRLGYRGRQVDFDGRRFDHAPKCLICASPERIEQLIPVAQAHFGDRMGVKRSFARFLEFYKPGVDKGTALGWLAERAGLECGQIIAAGDSAIDLPMLRFAGLGVAVQNAEPEVLAAADYIAPHANDSAIAHVIDKFIFNQS